uniref:Uncharacterized protein n=1 Tax=mine drainage metagenome TaxID=410659 RepID=E6PPZ9_9ZZZZ
MKKYLLIFIGLWLGIYLAVATFMAEKFTPEARQLARIIVIHEFEPSMMQPREFIYSNAKGKVYTATPAGVDYYINGVKKTPWLNFVESQTAMDNAKPLILYRLWLWLLPWLSLYVAAKLLNMTLSVRQLTRQT